MNGVDFFQWSAAGDEHFDAERYEEAADCYANALLNDPEREMGFTHLVYRKKAACLSSLRRYDDALRDINESISLDPREAEGYALRGDVHRGLGKYPEALADYGRAIRLDRKVCVYEYYHRRGGLYEHLGEFRRALKDYRRAVLNPMISAMLPDIAYRWHCDLGGVSLALGRLVPAIETYTRALHFDQDGAEAHYGRGLAYQGRGKTAEARADFAAASADRGLAGVFPAPSEGGTAKTRGTGNPYVAVTEVRRGLEEGERVEKGAEMTNGVQEKKVRIFLEKGNGRLFPDDLPEPGDDLPTILSFARSYNGFEAMGSFQACGDFANESLAEYVKTGTLPDTIAGLRACLFFEERRGVHAGDPDDTGVAYIYALIEAIRERVKRREVDG